MTNPRAISTHRANPHALQNKIWSWPRTGELCLRAIVRSSGYGYFAANLLHAASSTDVRVCLHNAAAISCDPLHLDCVMRALSQQRESKHTSNHVGTELSLFDRELEPFGSPALGWHLFELDGLKTQVETNLRKLDGIIVCSQWAARVLATHSFDENRGYPRLFLNLECAGPGSALDFSGLKPKQPKRRRGRRTPKGRSGHASPFRLFLL